jgi:polyisoprenyl-phosphate glycosyltransferase
MTAAARVCVVLPARNEADSLASLVPAIGSICEKLGLEHVVCVVDDGSGDHTWQTVQELHARSSRHVGGRRLSRNFGKEAAILAGLESIRADCYIVMDSDGQHPPELIPALVEKWRSEGIDVVNGVKADPEGRPPFSRISARGFNRVFGLLTSVDMRDASDYKLLSRRAVEAVLACGDYNFFLRGMSRWVGFRQAAVPFAVVERRRGVSQWGLGKLLSYAANAVVLYSYVPLYVLLVMGLVGLAISVSLGVKLLVQYFVGRVPEGYSTLLAVSLMSLSMTLVAMGILGLYLQNILDQVKRRPRYIVMDELDPSPGR